MATYNDLMKPGPVPNQQVQPTYTKPAMAPLPMRPTRTADSRANPFGADPLLANIQQQAQANVPGTPNNGNPQGANNMPSQLRGMMGGRAPLPGGAPLPAQNVAPPPGTMLTPQRQSYINQMSGQQGDLGRYRPPTLAGDGNNPMNWNDYGGYAYNLPTAFGPSQQRGAGPYGGYPSYLIPNWR